MLVALIMAIRLSPFDTMALTLVGAGRNNPGRPYPVEPLEMDPKTIEKTKRSENVVPLSLGLQMTGAAPHSKAPCFSLLDTTTLV